MRDELPVIINTVDSRGAGDSHVKNLGRNDINAVYSIHIDQCGGEIKNALVYVETCKGNIIRALTFGPALDQDKKRHMLIDSGRKGMNHAMHLRNNKSILQHVKNNPDQIGFVLLSQ